MIPHISSDMPLAALRAGVADAGRRMMAAGLSTGTSGNISAREDRGTRVAVTPSGRRCDALDADDICLVGEDGALLAGGTPSSETPLHLAVYRARPDMRAVVHAHPPYATTIACLRVPIPPIHYLAGLAGAPAVPCAPYAPFGSEELARVTVETLGDGAAVLLANHGLLVAGSSLDEALAVAEQLEFVARVYWQTLSAGGGILLDDEQMRDAIRRLDGYRGGGTDRA
jgi:L-fuculose-phosphate aldolase